MDYLESGHSLSMQLKCADLASSGSLILIYNVLHKESNTMVYKRNFKVRVNYLVVTNTSVLKKQSLVRRRKM